MNFLSDSILDLRYVFQENAARVITLAYFESYRSQITGRLSLFPDWSAGHKYDDVINPIREICTWS